MKGLLRLDFQILKASKITVLLILAFGLAMAYAFESFYMMPCFCAILFASQAPSTIITDKFSNFYPWEYTLPIKKEAVIQEKFFLTVLYGVLGLAFGLAMTYMLCALANVPILLEPLRMNLYITGILFGLGESCFIFFSYIFPKEFSSISMLSFALPIGVIMILSQITDSDLVLAYGLAALLSLLFFGISYFIAPKIIIKKAERR